MLRSEEVVGDIPYGLGSWSDQYGHHRVRIREGEVSLTDLWYRLHEARLAADEGIAIDDALRAHVRQAFPPPPRIDFRMDA